MILGTLTAGLSGVQRYIIIGLGVTVIAMGVSIGVMVWYTLDLKEQNGALEQNVAQKTQTILDLNSQILDLRAEAKKLDRLILKRDAAIRTLQNSNRKAEVDLELYIRANAERWGSDVVPNGVYERLFPAPSAKN